MIRAGGFTERVTLKRSVATQDDSGQPSEALVQVIGSRWAKVIPISGRETDYAERLSAQTTHTVELRAPLSFRMTDYLTWGSRRLEIEANLSPPRSGKIVLACKETV